MGPWTPARWWQRQQGDKSPDTWVPLSREGRGQPWRRLREQHPALVLLFAHMCLGKGSSSGQWADTMEKPGESIIQMGKLRHTPWGGGLVGRGSGM